MPGRHRGPPMLARWFSHIAVAAAVGIVGPIVVLFAATIGAEASAASAAAARDGLAVSTAARSAQTVHVPLTVLPVPVPSDPETTPSAPRDGQETFRGVSTVASAPVTTLTGRTEVPSPIEATPDSPHATETPDTTPTSPAETAAATSESSATPTEETTLTATPSAEPTDIGDVIDEVLGTEGAP